MKTEGGFTVLENEKDVKLNMNKRNQKMEELGVRFLVDIM